jgi:GNAT superfamily N-acetyltransferase
VPAFSLRPLAVADSDAVARVYRIAYDERLPWLAGRHTPEQDRWFFRERVFAELELVGAFANDELIGFIAFREGWIDQLYVLPERQSQGVGTALLAAARARFARFELRAFKRNPTARAFYLARGFRLMQETDGADTEEREPDGLFAWAWDADG